MTAPTSGGAAPAAGRRDWQDWTRKNIRRVGIGAGIVVVVVGAVLAYLASERRKEAFAAQALSQAWSTVESGNMALAANDLSRLVERYAGTQASDEAFVLLSELRLLGGGLENQSKFAEAARAYRSAADAAELGFLKAQYLIDAGRAFVLAKDTASAKAALGEVLAKYGELSQSAEARVRMGEIGGEVPPAPAPKPSNQGD